MNRWARLEGYCASGLSANVRVMDIMAQPTGHSKGPRGIGRKSCIQNGLVNKMSGFDYVISIGGAAGQGIATPGNILARLFARQGIHMYAYNAYQSIIRGGHSFLTVRCSDRNVRTHGDVIDLLICLNQDTMDRHLEHMREGTSVIYNSNTIEPGEP